jgi:hypothetical protein
MPIGLLGVLLATSSCSQHGGEQLGVLPPLPPLGVDTQATPRISGPVSTEHAFPRVAVSTAPGATVSVRSGRGIAGGGGSVTLDFADTDIREVAAQILGNSLHVNYTIDPNVHGTATLRTVVPLSTTQLIPVLQSLLQQNGATLVETGGVYRVLPVAASLGMAGGEGTAAPWCRCAMPRRRIWPRRCNPMRRAARESWRCRPATAWSLAASRRSAMRWPIWCAPSISMRSPAKAMPCSRCRMAMPPTWPMR